MIYSEDEDNEIAPAGFSGYGESDPLRGAELLSGVCVEKRSSLGIIMGAHIRNRSVHNHRPGNGKLVLQQDMMATAVRLASL